MSESKTQGIYILGNDRVIDDAMTLLNSLQQHAPDYPICLIPYDGKHHKLRSIAAPKFGIEAVQDPELFDLLAHYSQAIRGSTAPMYRKCLAWFGPFDEFIYLDLDIVVLHPLDHIFNLLAEYDFVFGGDYQTIGLKKVFTDRVLDRNIFTQSQLKDVFNAGFFASKKGTISREQLLVTLKEAKNNKDIFWPKLQDQPFTNFLVLRNISKRCNLRDKWRLAQDNWAGSERLNSEGATVGRTDGLPIGFIHWASFKRPMDRPHVDVWLQYRYPGKLGYVSRLMIRGSWFVKKLTSRLFSSQNKGWYKPSFQLRRLQRIIARRITSRL